MSNRLVALQIDINCGEYDCLRHCCDNLQRIKTLMDSIDISDIPLVEKMLCMRCGVTPQLPAGGGGATPPLPEAPPPPPTQINNCVKGFLDWIRGHRGEVTAARNAVRVIMGTLPADSAWYAWLALLETELHVLETAFADTTTSTPEAITAAVCQALYYVHDSKQALVDAVVPDALSALKSVLLWVDLGAVLSLGCCRRVVTVTPPPPVSPPGNGQPPPPQLPPPDRGSPPPGDNPVTVVVTQPPPPPPDPSLPPRGPTDVQVEREICREPYGPARYCDTGELAPINAGRSNRGNEPPPRGTPEYEKWAEGQRLSAAAASAAARLASERANLRQRMTNPEHSQYIGDQPNHPDYDPSYL